MPLFKGVSAFPITPADADGHIDTLALGRLLQRLLDAGVDSIGLLGSTGSYPYLTRDERRRAMDAALDLVGGRVPVLVGVGALRTNDAVQFAHDAEAAGASAGLLAPVSYTPLTEEEVFVHFQTVAAAVTMPLCIYNNPGTTHFSFSNELIARLSRLPNIAAVKNPAPEASRVRAELAVLRAQIPAAFSLGYSADWNAGEAMLAGGDAWYSVLAGLFPKPCMALHRAAHGGDADTARRLNAALEPMWALFRRYSSLRVTYAAARLLGICDAAPPRPILPLDATAEQEIAAVLQALDLD